MAIFEQDIQMITPDSSAKLSVQRVNDQGLVWITSSTLGNYHTIGIHADTAIDLGKALIEAGLVV